MKDELFANKIFFAILFFLILFFSPSIIMDLFHHESHAEMAIDIDISAPETTEVAEVISFEEMLAFADPAIGQKRAALCKSCHTFEKNGANGTGPNLYGVFDRNIASVAGFNYSESIKALPGKWSYAELDKFIANSQQYLPGTSMAQRVRNAQHRAEIIAYLNSLSDAPADLASLYQADAEEMIEEVNEASEE